MKKFLMIALVCTGSIFTVSASSPPVPVNVVIFFVCGKPRDTLIIFSDGSRKPVSAMSAEELKSVYDALPEDAPVSAWGYSGAAICSCTET